MRLTLAGGGHCQGMKQVVAVLLMFLSEEDIFWALVQLMTDEKHATHGRCLMWTAGCASGPGVSPQSSPGSRAGGDPSPVHLPISEGPWLPTLPSGSWSHGPQSRPHLDNSPFPAGTSASCLPFPNALRAHGQTKPHSTPSCAPSLDAKPRKQPGTPLSPTPWAARPVPYYQDSHPTLWLLWGGRVPGPDARLALGPGHQLSWASRSGACAPATPASQAVLPGKGMSSQGSGGPHTLGSLPGTPAVLDPPGHGSDLWGSGGSSVFFIPGFPKLLRFQAYHEHVLGSVLPQRKQHLVSGSGIPHHRGAVPRPLRGPGPPAGFILLLLGGQGRAQAEQAHGQHVPPGAGGGCTGP